jgi:hypothetical protein
MNTDQESRRMNGARNQTEVMKHTGMTEKIIGIFLTESLRFDSLISLYPYFSVAFTKLR